MLRSILIALPAGARALTPLAVVSRAARRGGLPDDNGAPGWLGTPFAAAAIAVLAAGEAWGDKLASAPDRIGAPGLLARLLTGGLCGAAVAPRRKAWLGAVLGASSAVASAYVTFDLRRRAISRLGQTPSGLLEDGLTLTLCELALRRL